MKINLVIAFNFLVLNVYGQESKINLKDIIGCWKFVEYVDTLRMKPITSIKGQNDSIEFKSNNQYIENGKKGDWSFNNEKRTITLYKNEFRADDKQMAKYFKKTPREATKLELLGIKIEGGYLYYLVASETETNSFIQVYKKMKRKNCPYQ